MTSTKLSVINPSTGEQIALLETDDMAAAEAKIERAWRRFSDHGSLLQVHERIEILERLIRIMERDKASFAQLIVAEGGKPLQDARVK